MKQICAMSTKHYIPVTGAIGYELSAKNSLHAVVNEPEYTTVLSASFTNWHFPTLVTMPRLQSEAKNTNPQHPLPRLLHWLLH